VKGLSLWVRCVLEGIEGDIVVDVSYWMQSIEAERIL
jgi:hypothetical protein